MQVSSLTGAVGMAGGAVFSLAVDGSGAVVNCEEAGHAGADRLPKGRSR
ncbi:hypothetical protein [Hyalangium rubrum]|uniref:Uncharacterized protein n=1 Tax=Hyalangium rubrum TaxID=3103134 RepID=A0ABU5HG16_9BACT|nr:hypothetical protein [Hyalangium sp. s54d21]MDY7232398.1 hypothetical protein [Hyalangium sp. s54d21]